MVNSTTLPDQGKMGSAQRRPDSSHSPRGPRNPLPNNREILDSLDFRAEFTALGVEIVGQPNAQGWASARAFGREDQQPSASVNLNTGRYRDFTNNEASEGFFEFAARAKGFADWREARDHYASRIGAAPNPPKPKSKPSKPQPAYASRDQALTNMATALDMKLVAWFAYPPINDQPWGIARFEPHDPQATRSKTFRPLTRGNDGLWRSLDPRSDQLPLFQSDHDLIAPSTMIFIVEGEAKAHALAGLGLAAVAPCHGSQSPQKSDWTPLAGKTIAILPDLDKNGAGEKFAQTVAQLVNQLEPPANPKILRLPGLELITKPGREEPGDGVDILNWLDERDAIDPQDLQTQLLNLADQTPNWTPPTLIESIDDWPIPQLTVLPASSSIPLRVFPPTVQQFIQETLLATQTASDFVSAAVLAVAGFACGNSFELRLLKRWTERSNLWIGLCGDAGRVKTPAIRYAMEPLLAIDNKLREQYHQEFTEYEIAKNSKAKGRITPPRPRRNYFLVTNATTAALKMILADTSRVLFAPDELRSIVASFGEFSSNNMSSDRQTYLSLWSREGDRTERKNAESSFCQKPFLSIVGGIQPSVLESLTDGDDGFLDRFLLAYPSKNDFPIRKLGIGDLSDETAAEWAQIVERLFNQPPTNQPLRLNFDRDGFAAFSQAFNQCEQRKLESFGRMRGIWAKADAQIARIALTLNRLRFASDHLEITTPISQTDVEAAAAVFEAFAAGAARVLAKTSTPHQNTPAEVSAILDWLRKTDPKPQTITAAALRRSIRSLGKPDTAQALDAALAWMETRQAIRKIEINRKGQPTWTINPRLHNQIFE